MYILFCHSQLFKGEPVFFFISDKLNQFILQIPFRSDNTQDLFSPDINLRIFCIAATDSQQYVQWDIPFLFIDHRCSSIQCIGIEIIGPCIDTAAIYHMDAAFKNLQYRRCISNCHIHICFGGKCFQIYINGLIGRYCNRKIAFLRNQLIMFSRNLVSIINLCMNIAFCRKFCRFRKCSHIVHRYCCICTHSKQQTKHCHKCKNSFFHISRFPLFMLIVKV